MILIKTDEDDEQVIFERETDSLKNKTERYLFEKAEDKLRLTAYKDDAGFEVYPPGQEAVEKVLENITNRTGKEVVKPPIYALKCPKCKRTISEEVEVEENKYGREKPVNNKKIAECPMCGEKEMKIYKHRLKEETRY